MESLRKDFINITTVYHKPDKQLWELIFAKCAKEQMKAQIYYEVV